MLKLKVSFNPQALKAQLLKDLAEQTKLEAGRILEDLKAETPVDTGLAQASWSVTSSSPTSFILQNTQDYVKYLNAGTSRQAPARFIEAVALRYGRPEGSIVTYTEELGNDS